MHGNTSENYLNDIVPCGHYKPAVMWIEHASPLHLLQLLRESMENMQNRGMTPSPDKVSSAADAMLRLSSSGMLDPVNARANAQMQPGDQAPALSPYGGQAAAQHQSGQIPAVSPPAAPTLPAQPTSGKMAGAFAPDEDSQSSYNARQARKQREFIPENRKDECYWSKRRKNNEAAKKSREKRRVNDMVLNQRIVELTNRNTHLQMEMNAMKQKFGWPIDRPFPVEGEIPLMKNDYFSDSDSESSNASFTSGSFLSGTERVAKMSMAGFGHDNKMNIGGSHLMKSPITASSMGLRDPEIPAQVAQQIPMLLPLVSSHAPGMIPSTLPTCLPRTALESAMPYIQDGRSLQPTDSDLPPPPLHIYPDGVRFPVPSQYNIPQENDLNGLRREPVSPGYSSSSSSPGLKIHTSQTSSESDSVTTNTPPSGAFNKPIRMRYKSQSDEPHYYGDLTKVVESSRSTGRKGVPFKLWHKISRSESQREAMYEDYDSNIDDDFGADPNQDMVSSTSHDQVLPKEEGSNPYTDSRYVERRKRNNVAARKCRENRKQLSDIRLQKATILETENSRLREEMQELSSEITNLKDLVEKKKQAQARGEPFELPPALDNISSAPTTESERPPVEPIYKENAREAPSS